MTHVPARGDIWLVTLSPTTANEQAGTRPCVVVSVDRFNAMPIQQAIVVPVTTKDRQLPHHISLAAGDTLPRPSWALCEAVRAVSTKRFLRKLGSARPEELAAITDQVVAWLIE